MPFWIFNHLDALAHALSPLRRAYHTQLLFPPVWWMLFVWEGGGGEVVRVVGKNNGLSDTC